MKIFYYFSFFALAGIVLSSCATQSNLSLKPMTAESRWIDGHEVVKAEQDSLKIVTSFDGLFDKYYSFDTEIFNLSNRDITISPENFNALMLDANKDTLFIENHVVPIYYGLDPEAKAQNAAEEMANAKRRHTISSILNVALVIGAVALAASTRSGRGDIGLHSANTVNTIVQLGYVKQAIDDNSYINRINKLSYEKGNWQAEPFKKTTLIPHSSLRGRVYIYAVQNASFLKLSYPTTAGQIEFMFEQQVLK